MEINLGNNFGGNMGVMPETRVAGGDAAKGGAVDVAKASRSTANLTIGNGPVTISSAEPTAEIPDGALTRDDDLGKMVSAAFSLSAPPMPDFSD